MLLTPGMKSEFEPVVMARGADYFHLGKVQDASGSDWMVRATVTGTKRYAVRLQREGRELFVSCSCPYFESDGPCKHLWAVLLLAEAKGFLRGDGKPIREVICDELPDEDPDGPLEEEEEEAPLPPVSNRTRLQLASLMRMADTDQTAEVAETARLVQARLVTPRTPTMSVPRDSAPADRPAWQRTLAEIARQQPSGAAGLDWPVGREILYVVDVRATLVHGLVVEVLCRDPAARGGFGKPRPLGFARADIARLPDPADRRVLMLLAGVRPVYQATPYGERYEPLQTPVVVSGRSAEVLLPELCATGRCRLRPETPDAELVPLAWDDGPGWDLVIACGRDEGGDLVVTGALRCGDERRGLAEPAFLTRDGILVMDGKAARFLGGGSFGWVGELRRRGSLRVPADGLDQVLDALALTDGSCRIELPDGLSVEEAGGAPRPWLRFGVDDSPPFGRSFARAALAFEYGGGEVAFDRPGALLRVGQGRLLQRDLNAERQASARLVGMGFGRAQVGFDGRSVFVLGAAKVPAAVRDLVADGWHVEAEGKVIRRPGSHSISVTSGVDWFELRASVDFGGPSASLPVLLAALRRREQWVALGDGTFGLLPEEWLRRNQLVAGLGQVDGDRIRYGRGQAGFLDALLAAEPEASCDAAFRRAREALARFDGIAPSDPPASFTGTLRPYQREGLGWLGFLREFGFGGCLADDMGLGKTVQVLALLDSRRGLGKGPSLVVVPRSLVFNWKEEVARFTPRLRLLDYTGVGRSAAGISGHDVVVTTYGTLKRDILDLKGIQWDYVVLDEAQAAKNAASDTAKAVRLLSARHRLALSGTPVENHLGELWSLLDFLNPGVLGKASAFAGKAARDPDGPTRALLARAVKPFILRRTKEKVAPELPAKVEQTLLCEMDAPQRRLYGELRDHYRRTLLAQVDRLGIARSKIHILEALLRLRQAACHPGLLDQKKAGEGSAKLDCLLPQLEELRGEGHKAVVFSQFTSFLALVRQRLDASRVPYEYLDGQTRDRAACVARFQSDPDRSLFLVSLKAGGLGLNLTSAGYVFILDPWWNPAVEAQAVDRAHRIGQTRAVFAYRLITKETIEEKVVELQKTKKRLAESILSEDAGLLQTLGREELELLLS